MCQYHQLYHAYYKIIIEINALELEGKDLMYNYIDLIFATINVNILIPIAIPSLSPNLNLPSPLHVHMIPGPERVGVHD